MQNRSFSNFSLDNQSDLPVTTNKYVYFKQNFTLPDAEPAMHSSKVLVNPHFKKKVFVNPNYRPASTLPPVKGKIHINPKITRIHVPLESGSNKIHINPKILKNISSSLENTSITKTIKQPITYASKTKLIRKPVKQQTTETSRLRTPVYSNYKTIKSSVLNSSMDIKNKLLFKTKYKLKRDNANKPTLSLSSQDQKTRNIFKLDNRNKHLSSTFKSRFVFHNRFVSISDIAKEIPPRTRNLINISGIMYKNSPNRLLKTSLVQTYNTNVLKQAKPVKKNRFKIIRSPTKVNQDKKMWEKNTINSYTSKKKLPIEKLKLCNIPCPYYRKFGKCKGKQIGKCHRKHDPDQIALCTKFLQGACVDVKCLLSHNVSPEKMPTCKYYLEGSCSRDNCPYLHVRISPKADICRNFLEGFCKKAAECDERHQFLCPDYEKKGTCLKPRCSYPHGRMVRKYSVFNKYKFAKKSFTNVKENTASTSNEQIKNTKTVKNVKIETHITRYYSNQNIENKSNETESNNAEDSCIQIHFRGRKKLGKLPSFILLEDK